MAAWSSDWWSNGWNGPVDPEQDELVKRLGAPAGRPSERRLVFCVSAGLRIFGLGLVTDVHLGSIHLTNMD